MSGFVRCLVEARIKGVELWLSKQKMFLIGKTVRISEDLLNLSLCLQTMHRGLYARRVRRHAWLHKKESEIIL